jgi:hypothetical protein
MEIFLLIGFVMLLILGPVMMLRPSPRERRLARIRQVAQQYRVKVQPLLLRQDTQFSPVLERNPHLADFSWSRFQRIADEGQSGPSLHGKWIQRKIPQGRFVWESADVRQKTNPAIDAVLAQWEQAQQPDFLALELGPRSVSIVWNEKGDSAEAEALCQLIEQLLKA